jgi:hypothetical protein
VTLLFRLSRLSRSFVVSVARREEPRRRQQHRLARSRASSAYYPAPSRGFSRVARQSEAFLPEAEQRTLTVQEISASDVNKTTAPWSVAGQPRCWPFRAVGLVSDRLTEEMNGRNSAGYGHGFSIHPGR